MHTGSQMRKLTDAHVGRGVAFEVIPARNTHPRYQRPTKALLSGATSEVEGAEGAEGEQAEQEDQAREQAELCFRPLDRPHHF